MTRLTHLILAMVIDSYGLPHLTEATIGATDANFRMLRYRPSVSDEPAVGLAAHVDGSYLTVLFQNDVDGFELRTRDGGDWVRLRSAGPNSLLVVAGQPLVVSSTGTLASTKSQIELHTVTVRRATIKIATVIYCDLAWMLQAWSNGRLHAPVHRVVVGGREDRLSCGVFLLPKKDLVIDAPPGVVTVETPRRFRPFVYMDYLKFKHANGDGEDVLDRFAGL